MRVAVVEQRHTTGPKSIDPISDIPEEAFKLPPASADADAAVVMIHSIAVEHNEVAAYCVVFLSHGVYHTAPQVKC